MGQRIHWNQVRNQGHMHVSKGCLLRKGPRGTLSILTKRVGVTLQVGTQTQTNGSESQSAADNTLISNAEHTECAVAMDQEYISYADDQQILGIPC